MNHIGQNPNGGEGAAPAADAPPQDLGAFMVSMNAFMESQRAFQQELLSTHRRVSGIEDYLGAQIAGE